MTVTLVPTVLKDWGVFPAEITIVGISAKTNLLKEIIVRKITTIKQTFFISTFHFVKPFGSTS
jgi:hypothetical protein